MHHEIILGGIRDEGIRIVIEKIHAQPELKLTGYEDCFGRISIRAGYFSTSDDAPLWTSLNSLERFCRELEECYYTLSGTAGHETYENNLALTVSMMANGHGQVRGICQPDMTKDNVLQFTFETDQTFIGQTVCSLRRFLDSIEDGNTIPDKETE